MEVFRTHLNMYNFRFYIIHRCSLLYFMHLASLIGVLSWGGLYGPIFCSKIHIFCYNFFCLRFFISFNIFPVFPISQMYQCVNTPRAFFLQVFFLLHAFLLLFFAQVFSPVISLIFHWVKSKKKIGCFILNKEKLIGGDFLLPNYYINPVF